MKRKVEMAGRLIHHVPNRKQIPEYLTIASAAGGVIRGGRFEVGEDWNDQISSWIDLT